MLDKLEDLYNRFRETEEQLADPSIMADQKRYTAISKQYKNLKQVVDVYLVYKQALGNRDTAQKMRKDPDQEMREMAELELEELAPRIEKYEEDLKLLLVPRDPEDERDVLFEIRSGAGGDEASLFAGDLLSMYERYFATRGWQTEVMEVNEGSVGGYNKIVLEVKGEDVYARLKFESGAHRVQRVPKTESQGRVHTSAATVVVLPKREMEDVDINKADLRTDTFRSSGAGGQHVNKTESGVRFTHIPTGIVAESTDGRSQHQNRETALQRLYQKIYDAQVNAHESEIANTRKTLVGSGDRSDKIRTYNFPQNRVTDHRIGFTSHNLTGILGGDLDELLDALEMAENTRKLGNEPDLLQATH